MTAKTRTVGSRKSHQSLERSAGAPEPPVPGTYYRVEPGETGPEYFRCDLKGLTGAIARAGWLSVANPPQRILVTRPDGHPLLPGCQDKVIRRYRGGQEIWSAASGKPDESSGRPEDPRLTLALRGM
jgi:hypothetical protein